MGWLDRLCALKKASGLTTEEISLKSGVAKGTLNKLFAGQTKDPQLSTIQAVVHSLGFSLDALSPFDETSVTQTKKDPSSNEESSLHQSLIAYLTDATAEELHEFQLLFSFLLYKREVFSKQDHWEPTREPLK